MTQRTEVLIAFSVLIVTVALLAALWGYLANSTMYSRPGVGKAPYNTAWPADKAAPW